MSRFHVPYREWRSSKDGPRVRASTVVPVVVVRTLAPMFDPSASQND